MKMTPTGGWADRHHASLRLGQLKVSPDEFPYEYTTCCVQSTGPLIDAMTEAAEEVTADEMGEQCCLALFNREFGYDGDLSVQTDWAVTFYKSVYDGRPCYYLEHSRIEWIWTEST